MLTPYFSTFVGIMDVLFTAVCVFIFCCSCRGQADVKLPQQLNRSAAIVMVRNLDNNKDSLLYAIHLLDSSIHLDDTIYNSYQLKAQAECKLGRYSDAVKDCDRVLKLKKNFLEVRIAKGFILEKMDKKQEAMRTYRKSLFYYDQAIKSDTVVNMHHLIDRAFLIELIYGKQKGIHQMKILCRKYPEHTYLKDFLASDFYHFNRKQFISSFGK